PIHSGYVLIRVPTSPAGAAWSTSGGSGRTLGSAGGWASGGSRRQAHSGRGLVESGRRPAVRTRPAGRRAPWNLESSRSSAPSAAGRSRRAKAASAPFAIGLSVVGTSGWRTRSCGRRRSTNPSSPGARSAERRSGRRQRERDGCGRCRSGRLGCSGHGVVVDLVELLLKLGVVVVQKRLEHRRFGATVNAAPLPTSRLVVSLRSHVR